MQSNRRQVVTLALVTMGLANIAAARGIDLLEVTSTVEGDIDLNGILGLSKEVRNGYSAIRVHFDVRGDAPAEQLRELVPDTPVLFVSGLGFAGAVSSASAFGFRQTTRRSLPLP